MKRFQMFLLAGALSAAGSTTVIAEGSLSPFPPKVLPVLVQVNAHGKVTSASPAVALPPAISRMLDQNLSQMITRPAIHHGHPVASQFVINLALQATPRPGGDYDARFAYVSTAPVPIGTWHWVSLNDRRFALAGPNDGLSRPRLYFNADHPSYSPGNAAYRAPAASFSNNSVRASGGQASAPRSSGSGH